jgi:hypothetical protein
VAETYYPKCRVDLDLWGAATPRTAPPDIRVEDLVPDSATVENNDYQTADTFSVTLPRTEFPVDPRALRDVRVRVWMGDAGDLDAPLPNAVLAEPMIVGFVDEPPLELGEDGESITLSGRDYTAIALDTQWGAGAAERKFTVRIDQPLDLVVRVVLLNYPTLAPLAATVRVAPPPRSATSNTLPPVPAVPVLGGLRARTFRWRADQPVWEGLSELVSRAGWAIWVDGESVVLSAAEGVYGDTLLDTPRLVWGENLTRLTITRKLTRDQVHGVEVRAYNTREGKVHVAQYPPGAREYTRYTPARDPRWSDESAERLATQAYKLLCRQQMTGSFETEELREGVHRLTELRHSRTVRIAVDPSLEALIARGGRSNAAAGQIEALLSAEDFHPDVARVISENWRELLTPWQVARATHSWGADQGYRLSADVVNTLVFEL